MLRDDNSANSSVALRTVKLAIIKSFGRCLIESKNHVENRHMDKREAVLRRRVTRMVRRSGQPPEKVASTFVDSEFSDIALAVMTAVFMDSSVLEDIAFRCVFGGSNDTYIVIAEMPTNVHGYSIVIRDGEYIRLECYYIKAVLKYTSNFRQALAANPDRIPENCSFCTIATIYPSSDF